MDVMKICGVVLITATGGLVLKQLGSPVRPALMICGIVSVLLICLPMLEDIVNTALEISRDSPVSEAFPAVLKVTSVALICEVCSEIAGIAESPALSKAVLWAGKFEIILISLPLFRSLVDAALSLAGKE